MRLKSESRIGGLFDASMRCLLTATGIISKMQTREMGLVTYSVRGARRQVE